MTSSSTPDPSEDIAAAFTRLTKSFASVSRTLAAQNAMGWAYQGNLARLEEVLARMDAEQVRGLSAAAALLEGAADAELARRTA
ncbi:hypothetical protein Ppa06_58030 [Planomonospora parontospora subsp. parontospora]|uniref:Uncharacterized protein n=2 Tax=Planomonospora parontospora TaxID=58119 RepID=A0AA37BLX2_9ACTN|nr:hypothetical protein [Planomonospora parontospora]GGK90394.1 hypothetical protein GCM10010126_57280 [Planomonospora parontospora]GII12005.1 hypothetical protein Ppa06_58030 [Planomonospora parontospora subsp. parontospora]